MSVQTSDIEASIAGGFAARLLAWYDRSARDLPWRVPPGSDAVRDPYRVWLAEIMLQQTTVAAVAGYFHKFVTRWPTVADLAAAEDGDVMAAWAGLGYYARARNLLACARTVVQGHGGHFPSDEAGLRALPGIGDYTAASVAAIAFGRPAVVVDANVERVMARHRLIETPLPAACTSTVCPAFSSPFSTTICQAVRKQSGIAAASSKESPAGRGRRFASGTTM